MHHARVPQRSVRETRVGAFSAFALCLAATAGTLAGGHRPVGTDIAYDTAMIEQPGWGDDLDHVIVMTDAAFDPDSTPLPPVTAPIEQPGEVGLDLALPAASPVTTAPVAGEPVRVGSVRWDPTKHGPVMQRDRLHPAFPGLVALTERTMECAIGDAACREQFDFTPQDVKARILDGLPK